MEVDSRLLHLLIDAMLERERFGQLCPQTVAALTDWKRHIR